MHRGRLRRVVALGERPREGRTRDAEWSGRSPRHWRRAVPALGLEVRCIACGREGHLSADCPRQIWGGRCAA
ncbi:hypothetical protein EJO66_31140 [Variovorax beijingensis]|uniref:CCHC-type domain-containing protein n=1 Tax=Variovorax beijingensis TaxID=2496117 RepID=A0ABX9ZX36_9BURK|nr:hypothetical protein EJO66_31140 [Variovorax beijingensis]